MLLRAKEDYTSFLDSLEDTHNIYSRSQKISKIFNISELQNKIISKNDAYISYILGDPDGFGLVITKTNAQLFKIKNISELVKLSKKYKRLLEQPQSDQKTLSTYQATSNELYNILIPQNIRSFIIDKKITFVPDSFLQNIPFEALQTSTEPHSYFIKSNDISYAYSISFLVQNGNIKRQNKQIFIGFAPVNFTNMASLTRSKEEVGFGAAQFSATTFLYDTATKENFINNSLGSSIIHLASHSNASDTENPWIAFNDEKLTLDELYLTRNSADLVVLSACETSLGELNQGEGVMSLSRGFFNTGANSALSTLWNVNDKSSSEIIIDFYKQLKKGKTKSEALRQAKLNYLDTHKLSELSPYYWASFVLIGDANSMSLPPNYTFYYILLLVTLIGSISFSIYKKRKN